MSVHAPRRLVVVGASAGGVGALSTLVADLDPALEAAVLVVLHVSPSSHSVLPQILERAGRLPGAHPRDREPMVSGQIYVAPPDRHLLVHGDVVRVARGPWENGYRPSIDALFRSAARWYGPRVIAAVLSGALDDGAAGLAAVSSAGGTAIVQDPDEAEVRDMPAHALDMVPSAKVLPISGIAAIVNDLAARPLDSDELAFQPSTADVDPAYQENVEAVTEDAAGFGCPDCGGSLFEMPDAVLRFRCRVGHGWSASALVDAHGRKLEEAMWIAVRILEENDALQERLLARSLDRGRVAAARRLETERAQRESLLGVLREAIADLGSVGLAGASDHASATPDHSERFAPRE